MGRKQGRGRQLIHLCVACLACLFFLGCSTRWVTRDVQAARPTPVPEKEIRAKNDPQPAPVVFPASQPAAPPVADVEPQSPPAEVRPSSPPGAQPSSPSAGAQAPSPPPGAQPPKFASLQVQRARKLMAQRDDESSVKLSEKALLQAGNQGPADEALFSLGLIYATLENPKRDYAKALTYFQRLVKEFPKSPLAEEARAWAGLLQENQSLKEVIEKTKQVDIAVDEKKREIGK